MDRRGRVTRTEFGALTRDLCVTIYYIRAESHAVVPGVPRDSDRTTRIDMFFYRDIFPYPVARVSPTEDKRKCVIAAGRYRRFPNWTARNAWNSWNTYRAECVLMRGEWRRCLRCVPRQVRWRRVTSDTLANCITPFPRAKRERRT